MTVSAADVAAAFRHMRADLTPGRLHRLLFLAQGHHLAWHGEPLFTDPVVAWDAGPVVPALRGRELDGDPGYRGLDNGLLNTIGYVSSRYGNLHLHDLDLITRNSAPYVEADRGRSVGTTVTVDRADMAAYFKTVDVDPDAPMVDAAWLEAFLARSREAAERHADRPGKPDDMDRLRAWAASLREQAAAQGA